MNPHRLFLPVYFVLIYVILSFLVLSNYFSLDEPNILWEIKKGSFWGNYYPRFISEGRPFYGLLQFMGIKLAGNLEGLKYLRLVSILITGVFCCQLFRFMLKHGANEAFAFFTALLIFTLPAFSVFIAWSETYAQHVSSILSFFSSTFAVKVYMKLLEKDALTKWKENCYLLLAVGLQIISLFFYQGLALAFMLPPFVVLLLNNTNSINKIKFFIACSLVFFISLGIYYQCYKSMLFSTKMEVISRGKIGVNDYSGKLLWFCGILKESSKLHLLLLKNSFFANLFSYLFLFIILRDLIKKRFAELLLLLVSSVLFFLPHLLIGESWGASRNFALIEVAFVFYLVNRINEIWPFYSVYKAAFLGLLFVGIMALNIKEGWEKPMHKDYQFVKAFVEKLPVIDNDTLHVYYQVPPINFHEKKSFLKCYYDEFNAPVFFREWPVEPSIKCLYYQRYPQIPCTLIDKMILIKQTESQISADKKNTFFIDFNYP